jgi:uncharacterized protein YbaR (Trm112 family)
VILCPRCAGRLDDSEGVDPLRCAACTRVYPRFAGVPVLLRQPERWLAAARAHMDGLVAQASESFAAIAAEAEAPDLLPQGHARCQAMLAGARQQIEDIRAVLAPLLADAPGGGGEDPFVVSPLERIATLYRDWGRGDDGGPGSEICDAEAEVARVLEGAPLGRMLVLGSGGGRLAYDLHLRHGATETIALDVDPFLTAVAQTVIRGGRVPLTEASVIVRELDRVSRKWLLEAPDGAIDPDRFRFLIADGLAPPLAPGQFDTVVTPWFIDQAPRDLRDVIGTVHALLQPGGRWINTGPLLYPTGVPLSRRFSRDELFDLAERAGFRVGPWSGESRPYLVSPCTGRGKVEWVLTFAAIKQAQAPADRGGPPAWLLFPHLPVPTFAGQSRPSTRDPVVETVVGAIDGRRSIDDLGRVLASKLSGPAPEATDMREALRRVLLEVHPLAQPAGRLP